jgi:hypothetical protein
MLALVVPNRARIVPRDARRISEPEGTTREDWRRERSVGATPASPGGPEGHNVDA